MLWKVIVFLVILVIALLFIGFNLGNRTSVSVGFHVWPDVPVFLSMFFSFAFGILCMVPFLLRARFGRRGKKPKAGRGTAGETPQEPEATPPAPPKS
jgi:uncharacterized integral membrane protein